ncbi:MAG TPA: hypothetical protein VLW88_00710 [Hyphomicrobium sp.]|jgi:hypothetical protein|nr:hypothetical protein [Hyphomicrobium sp.]
MKKQEDRKRVCGAHTGEFVLPESLFDELPEELAAFEGGYSTDPVSVAERNKNPLKRSRTRR